ncbi:hypothetical protein AXF42_Ash004008 [Apostasia shenzhenica]|uniref:FHA domain-containing protein n=1 Tax=Apostasia shenzhenica TaxID=1088818 RepID=A0A2I0AIJ0_9ASPA|nr:hypothetical protein AXF42_Ash004008 [Apostasia shenzhenica]
MAVGSPVDRHRHPTSEELSVGRSPVLKPAVNPQDGIRAVARNFSDQPFSNPEPGVWAILTAISKEARRRPQGMNMLLIEDEHCIGRCVEDPRFQITSITISANHCKIFREREAFAVDNRVSNPPVSVYLKDTSTNGTFLNWVKLKKASSKAKLKHGDIISFVAPPHDDNSYAFVYREVCSSTAEGSKRKSEDCIPENKRLKGIGIGALDGPISLDDIRSLQRSNMELRQQLESHVLTIESLHSENRAVVAFHENELKEQKEAVSNSLHNEIKELQDLLVAKQEELDDLCATSAELQNLTKDLNERLNASLQSRADADDIINSQKVTISELEAQLHEERNQRRNDREKAEADLKSALQRAHIEAQEEIKRHADVYLRQHREQQEFIAKLQDSEKESRLLVETLRSKMEDARESLVTAEKKARQLEAQFHDEQSASATSKKKMDALETELRKLRKELENEKVAREEAWAKVSALELEIAAAIRDLSIEKQRFQGARERIILRETQLRAFYSTTEEISALFTKQQEQLKAMQKTLEDEENYENSLFAVDSNGPASQNLSIKLPIYNTKQSSRSSAPKNALVKDNAIKESNHDDDDLSSTEKNDCEIQSQDGDTQNLECTSAERLAGNIFADMDGVGTAVVPDGDLNDTERVLGTESQLGNVIFCGKHPSFHKCSNLAGDTMQIDDEVGAEDDPKSPASELGLKSSPPLLTREQDTQTGTLRTNDLLASEAAGSWAIDTAPSVNGENEPAEDPGPCGDADANAAHIVASVCQAVGSWNDAAHRIIKHTDVITAPDCREQYHGYDGAAENESTSDAETEEGSNRCDDSGEGGDSAAKGNSCGDAAKGGSDFMIEDSVG